MARISLPRIEWDTVDNKLYGTEPGGAEFEIGGGAGATTPGGSSGQVQYHTSSDTFGGASGLTYDVTNNRPVMVNGYKFTYGAYESIFTTANLTANRAIAFPDASDTLVGKATADTLTNKTINATNNTITDTSAVLGDILVHNGTKFVRLAKGASGTFLGVSGGAVGYYTPSTGGGGTPGGSSGQIQYNNGGAFGGTANISYSGGGLLFNTSGFISMGYGGANYATTGLIRFDLYQGNLFAVRNSTNTGNMVVAAYDGSGRIVFGSDFSFGNAFSNLDVYCNNLMRLGGSSMGLALTSAQVGVILPISGYSSNPVKYKRSTDVAFTSTTYTISGAQKESPVIKVVSSTVASGTDLILYLPTDNGVSSVPIYFVYITINNTVLVCCTGEADPYRHAVILWSNHTLLSQNYAGGKPAIGCWVFYDGNDGVYRAMTPKVWCGGYTTESININGFGLHSSTAGAIASFG